MKRILITILIVFTYIFGQSIDRCGTMEAMQEFKDLGRGRDRPVNQTFYESPSGHFYIHYDTTGFQIPLEGDENNNNIPDYVELTAIMADSARHVLIDIMGFESEPSDNDGYYDVYLRDDLPSGWYGVTRYEGNGRSYNEIDNDFEESNFSTHGNDAMKVTMVHEYFHAIQYGYSDDTSYDNVFFYEMSSTWFEDVLVPEVNDYLEMRYSFFSGDNPTQNIESTDGYSIALYGHYLTRIYDGVEDEMDNQIIRLIWEDFANTYRDAIQSLDHVITVDYSSSFIESWVGFVASNLYNGFDPTKYFYEDQALIGPINTSPIGFSSAVDIELNIDDRSVAIESFRLSSSGGATQSILEINILPGAEDYYGNVAYTGSLNEICIADDQLSPNIITVNDKIHFIFGHPDGEETLNIEMTPSFSALPPTDLIGQSENNSVVLRWSPSPGPGDNISYHIYRNNDSLSTTLDITFFDGTIEPETNYLYFVTAENDVGESYPSNSVDIFTWPDDDEITNTEFIMFYPNPLNIYSDIFIILDAKSSYQNPKFELYSLLGRRIFSTPLPPIEQGRTRINIPNFDILPIASGIYFAQIKFNNSTLESKKILILK